jgi:Protein of unknown function (DUF2934)
MSTNTVNPARVPSLSAPTGVDLTDIPTLPAVAAPPARPEMSMEGDLQIDEVRGEAYRLFLDRGGEHGHDIEDWLAAEELVRRRT